MKKITAKQLKREILSICDQYPNLTNPLNSSGTCEYFVEVSQVGQSQRCLIGEWLNRYGVAVDQLSNAAADHTLTTLGSTLETTDKAKTLAFRIQQYADNDGATIDTNNPRKWGEIAAAIRSGIIRAD